MNGKEAFCRSLEWLVPVQWFDLEGTTQLAGDRVATIKLASRGVHEHYPGFCVTITHKTNGKITDKYFRFDDYLDRSLTGRTDGRRDYPLGSNLCFEVIAHIGWQWYIAIPKTTRPFCQAVEQYIGAFK